MIDPNTGEEQNYKYFQMKPQQVFCTQDVQDEIFPLLNQVVRDAGIFDSYTRHNTPSLVSCMIGFLLAIPSFLTSLTCFSETTLQFFHQCKTFSLTVHHSKFSTLLSVLIQFLGFTCGKLSGLTIYVRATNLGTENRFFHKHNLKYHVLHNCEERNNPSFLPPHFLKLHTLPSSVTAYLHSYPGISRIKKWLKVIQESGKTCTTSNHLSFQTFGY